VSEPVSENGEKPAALGAEGVGLTVAVVLCALFTWWIVRDSGAPATSASARASAATETKAERYRAAATASCKPRIQALARWDYEWTDGWTVPVFSHSKEQSDGTIVYVGDRLKLQNGFGAWRHVRYGCIYDPRSDRVVDVQITE
jgi:hypothetical protein